MALIDQELKEFIEGERAILVATRSQDLCPNALRGWGTMVSEDGNSVEVFVDRPAAATCVANLHDNGRIAVCYTDIVSNRAVQLKGRCVEIADPRAGDWATIDGNRDGFVKVCEGLGFPGPMIRNLWSMQVLRIRFVVETIYDQTPGPKAGRAI